MLPVTAAQVDSSAAPEGLAVYVHWPFCKFKCHYCDFNSHVRENVAHEDWTQAYLKELAYYRSLTGPRRVGSVFFGGGTPSLMEPKTVEAVLKSVDTLWGLPPRTEVTLEANPTSVEAGKLEGFKAAGVNRVSLGVQALDDASLKKLSRQHSAAEAVAAVKLAARIFERFSFDLIYARSGQQPAEWRVELAEALKMAGGHLSLYQLTIEEGTQFHTLHARGELTVPDADTGAQFYELTQEATAAAGLPAYEISNHARPGEESRHNLAYWRYGDYAGIGPGAHGRLTLAGRKTATRAHRAPELWMERVKTRGHGAHDMETLETPARGREMIMMGLRLIEGMQLANFRAETQTDFSDFVSPARLEALIQEGLLDLAAGRIKATPAGRQRLNAVLGFLLSR
jgi:oxygen-independent coproporphyrinogen-3 oxidase